MELLRRPTGDQLLSDGHLTDLLCRLRRIAPAHDLTSVIAYAFDTRTRMLPFMFTDTRMVPAGVRAVGSAMVEAGFPKTRIVLQQWNRNFRPAAMRLDGRVPDLFMVSSMAIHGQRCQELIADASRIPADRRPLILVGGPKAIYEPWEVLPAQGRPGADVAVTGEEYVLLDLLETLLSERATGERLRATFLRVRNRGVLDDVPGLVYARTDARGAVQELVDTGPQRLLGHLDELPHPVHGFGLLERPTRSAGLATQALPASQVARHAPIAPLVMTFGCRFGCHYCPITAFNQRQYRLKSPPRIAHEMTTLYDRYGLKVFFGTDDNFFNDPPRAAAIVKELAQTRIGGKPLGDKIIWGTEATIHDTLRMKDHLHTARRAGLRALWLGVEDMTGSLIRKGQSVAGTLDVFTRLRSAGILPMPMLMHHDSQPLLTRGSSYGLLNQIRLLRKAGAITLQVLMISPATGSRSYEEAFSSGQVVHSAGGKEVQPHMRDGNYVIASGHAKPWRKQINLMLAYLYFYNPLQLGISLLRLRNTEYPASPGAQVLGMLGLLHNIRRTLGWALLLLRGRIRRSVVAPCSDISIRRLALPGPGVGGIGPDSMCLRAEKRPAEVVGR